MWQLFSRPDWVDDIQCSLSAINRKVNQIMTTQAEFDTKVSAISSTLAVVAGGVNATLQNTANLEAEIARLKALDIDTSGLDTILGDAKKIEAVLVPAVDPGQVTPPVTEIPVVQPAPDAVVVAPLPVPDESEPVVTVPDETVTTEEPTA